MARTELRVPGISCAHCEQTIREALTPLEGVRAVAVDIRAKQVTVDYDEDAVSVDRMTEVLGDEEYPAEAAT